MTHTVRQNRESRSVHRMLWSAAACAFACGLGTSIANGQQGRQRYPLNPSQIVGEMQSRQLPVRDVHLSLAVPITTAVANPPLEIQAVALLNSHQMRLRVSCRKSSECLPFFAIATLPEELTPASVSTKHADRLQEQTMPVSETTPAVALPPASGLVKHDDPADPPILRSGSPATLDLDEQRVHIRIEVICLESGAAGDKIRVASRDHKQIYVAKIVTPTLLKGNL